MLSVPGTVKVFLSLAPTDMRKFGRRIHEQIMPAINRAGGQIVFTELFVVHAGSDQTPEGRRGKLIRDLRLLG